MSTHSDKKPSGQMQSDPNLYKLDSVMGVVTFSGRAVDGATVTIVKSGEVVRVSSAGAYIVVLDPKVLGSRHHELDFAAPGHKTERHEVLVPDKQQIRLDVALTRAT